MEADNAQQPLQLANPKNTMDWVCFSSVKRCFFRMFCHHPTPDDQDKGFAWLVLFWSTLSGCLTTGLFYGSYGSLNIILQKKFNISVAESSLICSLNSFLWLFTAPIASVLTKIWSCRIVQMTGGCMVVVGLGGCAFADKVWQVYPLYGVIAGLGASLCYVSVPAVLVHHFRERKNLAFAISMLGNRGGGSAWASLSQLMFSSIGFSQTMGILALIETILLLAGLFMTESKSLGLQDEEGEPLISSTSASDQRNESEKLISDKIESTSENEKHDSTSTESERSASHTQGNSQLVLKMKTLLKDWTVWCLILNFGLWSFTSHGFYFFINDYLVKYCGISETDAALGVSIMGIGSIAGCLLNISISKLEFDRVIFSTPMSSIFGVATVLMVFTNSKAMLYILTATYGVSYGLTTSSMYGVCYTFHGAELMTIVFGLGMCAQGFTGLLTGPICWLDLSFLYQHTLPFMTTEIVFTQEEPGGAKAYLQTNVHKTAGIIFAGGAGVAASLVMIPVIVTRLRQRRYARI